MRRFGHILEIDGDALQLVGSKSSDDITCQLFAAIGIGQEFGNARSVPFALGDVLHRGQDGDTRLVRPHVIDRTTVDIDLEIEIGPVQRQPAGDDPIQPVQRPLQGIEAPAPRSGIPVDVETDRQGASLLRRQDGGQHPRRCIGAQPAQASGFQPAILGLGRQADGRSQQAGRDGLFHQIAGRGGIGAPGEIHRRHGLRHDKAGNETHGQHCADQRGCPSQSRQPGGTPPRGVEENRLFTGHSSLSCMRSGSRRSIIRQTVARIGAP